MDSAGCGTRFRFGVRKRCRMSTSSDRATDTPEHPPHTDDGGRPDAEQTLSSGGRSTGPREGEAPSAGGIVPSTQHDSTQDPSGVVSGTLPRQAPARIDHYQILRE